MPTLTAAPTCPRCQRPVVGGVEHVVCDGCLATHHARCWHQAGGCSALLPPAQEPQPAARPHKIRIKRHTWESEGAVARRRALVKSLGTPTQPSRAEESPVTAFVPVAARGGVGTRGDCDTCGRAFVVHEAGDTRCSRCQQSSWWKVWVVFGVIVLWKLLF